MRNGRTLSAAGLVIATVLFASQAFGQATRTWVSGVGDDVNPCSRTAPCKTFAGAISKTAAGGEIDVLDPGGFGGVTITKSISIEADGVIAGVLVSGTNGITVSAGPNDVVVLRGLTIEGLDTGLSGVQFNTGAALYVDRCDINDFITNGILFQPSGTSFLSVKDTTIRTSINVATGAGGLLIRPTGAGVASASLERVTADGNLYGIRVDAGGRASAKNCIVSMNQNNGFVAYAPSGVAGLDLDGCLSAGNGRSGVAGVAGVSCTGPQATIRMGNTTVTNNTNGLVSASGGLILSYGNNSITGNSVTDGSPTGVLTLR